MFELVAGMHRLSAAQGLGWTEVEAVEQSNLTALQRRGIELEENIRRREMTWQERAKAVVALDELKRREDPNWTLGQTAAIAGETAAPRVSEAAKVVKMMTLFPEIAEAKNISQATKWANKKAKQVLRVQEVASGPVDYSSIEERIILGDSVEVIKSIPNESFHAIITDPPFGVDYGDRVSGTIGELSEYADGKAAYRRILTMAPDMYRVLKPDGWLVWFCGISWYEEIKSAFRSSGFTVDEIPIIWDRSGGRTFTSRPDRWFGRGYDIAIHALKGSPVLTRQSTSNIIRIDPVATSERELLVERPVGLYADLIQRLTIPGEIVADFFVGSGSCPSAAVSTGRQYFGVELSPERRAYAIQKIKAHTPTEKK